MTLITDLAAHFPAQRLKHKLIELHAYSSDASFYQLIPRAIVFPVSVEEIQCLFVIAKKNKTSLTFRTAGTSLSGQSVTDGILVDLSRHWNKSSVELNGEVVRVQPGITGRDINHLLKKYGRKIGPDPASINAAMMGGILSNNSSGMCCGVLDNSYHTLQQVHFILANGNGFNTALANDYKRFEEEEREIFEGIHALRNSLWNNEALLANIRRKYQMKNTVGYSINAFVDYEHPLDILAHLLIGAEGTLAFIAEAALKTIPDKPFKKTGLLFFDSPKAACDAIAPLKETGVEALEFMDRPALRSIENLPDTLPFIQALPANTSCILCEYQSDTAAALAVKYEAALAVISSLPLVYQTDFTTDAVLQSLYWKLRKGMYPSVAAVRAKGTSVMLEDVAVPVDRLGEAIVDLQQLFLRHGYLDAIVFGHAKEGNLHFLVSQSVSTGEAIRKFELFNDALAELIIHRYQGSLKAEHGTGRQIAPYVADEWGEDGYAIMELLKKLLDPNGILNPGVIINADKKCHIKNIKSLPVVEAEVDKCVECGYCEHTCPSRDYTLTPRQRIVLRRTLSRMKSSGDKKQYDEIVNDYQHYGLDTCAVDGMCATECPVNINTGDLVKRLRTENHSDTANAMALLVANYFGWVESLVTLTLYAGNAINRLFGKFAMYHATMGIRKLVPAFPIWTKQLTQPLSIPMIESADPEIIYFPCCMNRMMGADIEKDTTIVDAVVSLAQKANIRITIPSDSKGSCCGQAFSSKGFTKAYQYTVNKMVATLWQWTKQGRVPVVLDITSCTYSLKTCRPYLTADNQQLFDRLTILDSIEFAADILLSKLSISTKKEEVIMHPVCSVHKMNLSDKLEKIGRETSDKLVIPFNAGCCGMAGDRGFYYPELLRSASGKEASEVLESSSEACYSTGKPCEMSMSETTGKNYRSIFYLLDEVSDKK
ncbi:MAG: FAD-binding and (Fe-S)-binding domain-containing protein [Sediminibacterium sp.]|nr:FAD-binding and (Fe-S)-binding domain-containing protein [Sediminibacterium sp.]MDP3127344.1 FAD-binding and (Fe-S)-binding domain-containing protein [Sediminibacterium sp.]